MAPSYQSQLARSNSGLGFIFQSRTMKRDNVSEDQVRAILASQASREQRLALADDVVKNNPSDPDLLLQITDLHEKYLAMCKKNLRK